MPLLINEVHPNQNSGSEWIELFCEETNADLSTYSIYDAVRKIYQFSDERCSDNLLVVEVSGLNNDQDSVIVKQDNGEIIDSFSYQSSEKGLSWSRQVDSNFVLSSPSRGANNPAVIEAEPSTSPTPRTSITSTPSVNLTPTNNPTSTNSPTVSISPTAIKTNFELPYTAAAINLQATGTAAIKRDSRLVILGQNPPERQQILGVIMASCLMLLSAIYLLYVKKKSSSH